MAKRITDKQKDEMIHLFTEGETIDELADKFNCTNLTISRNLKKQLGEKKYKELINKRNTIKKSLIQRGEKNKSKQGPENTNYLVADNQDADFKKEFVQESQFLEVTPLNYEFDNELQTEVSSVPIEKVTFPKIVYMLVDKKIELEIKLLKDYPEWQFLPKDDLNRKTIQVYYELKNAKRNCYKDQKVIKVPNTDVFRLVSTILVSRGITRIVSEEALIAL